MRALLLVTFSTRSGERQRERKVKDKWLLSLDACSPSAATVVLILSVYLLSLSAAAQFARLPWRRPTITDIPAVHITALQYLNSWLLQLQLMLLSSPLLVYAVQNLRTWIVLNCALLSSLLLFIRSIKGYGWARAVRFVRGSRLRSR